MGVLADATCNDPVGVWNSITESDFINLLFSSSNKPGPFPCP